MSNKSILVTATTIVLLLTALCTQKITAIHAASNHQTMNSSDPVTNNPWGYTFTPGGDKIYKPDFSFCNYFKCTQFFWYDNKGYVEECQDGTYSHSGGLPDDCDKNNGEWRPLYYSLEPTRPASSATPIPGLPSNIPDPDGIQTLPGMNVTATWQYSTNDIWITGIYGRTFQCYTHCHNLIYYAQFFENYNGISWYIVPAPSTDSETGYTAYAIDGISSSNIWTVGKIDEGGTNIDPLVEHWDGSKWSLEKPMFPGSGYPTGDALLLGQFHYVYAFSQGFVYAIGSVLAQPSGTTYILINKCNETSCIAIPFPEPATFVSLQSNRGVVSITVQLTDGSSETDAIDVVN